MRNERFYFIAKDVFGGALAAKRMEDLNKRVVEHNILVIRKYYRYESPFFV
jgi:hypothetical protein